MNRRTARAIHRSVNLSYWMENPDWKSGSAAFDLLNEAVRHLPFSLYEIQKRLFFDTTKIIAVSGESVVAENGDDKVDKFMFRYPDGMNLEEFYNGAEFEIGIVANSLGSVAISTELSIKPARIFRNPKTSVRAVTQTQRKLDLNVHKVLDVQLLEDEPLSSRKDRTLSDIEQLLMGAEHMAEEHDFYPDIAYNSGNLRRNRYDGAVTLIDVLPAYGNGSRLIGDHPPANWIPHIEETLQTFEEIVGRAGG